MTTSSNPTATLTLEEERQHLEALLAQHKRNLYRLEEVKALKGLDTSTAILNEIECERQELNRIQEMLRALEARQEEGYLPRIRVVPPGPPEPAVRAYECLLFIIANLRNYLKHRVVIRHYCMRLHELLSRRLEGTIFPKLLPQSARQATLTSVADLLQYEVVVVLGEAGCGKTQLFEECASRLAREITEGNSQMPIPVLIRFNDLASLVRHTASRGEPNLSLLRYLAGTINRIARLGDYGSEWLCEKYARRRRFAIFIDNFDLVNEPHARSLAIRMIKDFVDPLRYAGNRLYLASRPRLFRPDEVSEISDIAKVYSIEPWSEMHFKHYVMSRRDIPGRVRREAATALAENTPIKELILIPFFWEKILNLHLNDQEIPRSEFALLHAFAESEYKRHPPPRLNGKNAILLLGESAKELVLLEDDIILGNDMQSKINGFNLDPEIKEQVISYLNKRCEFLKWHGLSQIYQIKHRYYRDYMATTHFLGEGLEHSSKFYYEELYRKQRDRDRTLSRLLFQALSVEGLAPLRKFMEIAASRDALAADKWYRKFVQEQELDRKGEIARVVEEGLKQEFVHAASHNLEEISRALCSYLGSQAGAFFQQIWQTSANEEQIELVVQRIYDLASSQAINSLILALKEISLHPAQVRAIPRGLLRYSKRMIPVLLDADNSLAIRTSSLVAIYDYSERQGHGLGLRELEPILATFDAELIAKLMATVAELFGANCYSFLARLACSENEHVVRAACEVLGELIGKELNAPNMVFVPAGPFLYGPDNSSITWKPFLIDKYAVSNGQYKNVVDEHEAHHLYPGHWTQENVMSEEWTRLPVVGISQVQAQEWAALIGKRLPDEREWEKAARWIDGRKYPWGNEWAPTKVRPASSTRLSVDALPEGRSVYGCYNMSGNVWEWARGFPAVSPPYVLKGGSFSSRVPSDLRCDNKLPFAKDTDTNEYVGFRCCKDIDPKLLE